MQMLSSHEPKVTDDRWNCRSWVMEVIELMTAKGWITTTIRSQNRLMPTLRAANVGSLEALAAGKPPVIYELDCV